MKKIYIILLIIIITISCNNITITDEVYGQIKKCKENKQMSKTIIKFNGITLTVVSVFCSPKKKGK